VYVFFDLYITLIKKIFWRKKCSAVGFIKKANQDLINAAKIIKVKQRQTELEKERKSEKKKTPLLELLEGCLCRMVNTISTAVLYDLRRDCWIFVYCDI